MKIEQQINSLLMSHPIVKKIIKRIYQIINVCVHRPKKTEGNISCISPQDEYDYFFGYYDKSPWDSTNRYMLCMKAKDTSKEVAPNEKVEILLIDTYNNNKAEKIAESNSWNVQQGCMAQWLGPEFDRKIIYNDFRDGKYCSVILDVFNKAEKIINMPIYSVSSDGKFAFSLDFSRLHRLRPGYGYSNIDDTTKDEKVPNKPCIWKVYLEKNSVEPYLYYSDFYNFETREDMKLAEHKVNHIMISPNNDKFMVIHRWLNENKKYSRLITCDIKSKELFNLSDDNMVSHCYWKSNNEILGFLNKKNHGNGYYILKDKTNNYERIWDDIESDGHPSYSSDGKFVLTDSYPNKKRIQSLKILTENEIYNIGKVFSPFKYDNETRCDLHPRWSRDDKKICFDGCFEGRRRLYVIDVSNICISNSSYELKRISVSSEKCKILFMMTSCKKCGPTNQTLNIIKNLDRNVFEPYLLTIYEEESNSQIARYLPYVTKHYTIRTSKKNILLHNTRKLDKFITGFKADLIHTVGLFPNYYISGLKNQKQITTLRNYVYEDYPAKFGKFVGLIMAKLQLKAVKNTMKVVTCSKSLKEMYEEKLKLNFDFIQNGVDADDYTVVTQNEKEILKKELNLDRFKKIFIYTGQFIERKNIPFLLKCFSEMFYEKNEFGLVLLGDGPLLNILKEQYKNVNNILFIGSSNNVRKYLATSDFYVSTSISEGLPNGALEALSCGVPVILSDINQHKELFMYNSGIGVLYRSGDSKSFKDCINHILDKDYFELRLNARNNIVNNFSSKKMSENYQKEYLGIIEKFSGGSKCEKHEVKKLLLI